MTDRGYRRLGAKECPIVRPSDRYTEESTSVTITDCFNTILSAGEGHTETGRSVAVRVASFLRLSRSKY